MRNPVHVRPIIDTYAQNRIHRHDTCNMFSSTCTSIRRTVLHDEELEKTNEANDLDKTERGDGIGPNDGGDAIGI